TLVSAPSHGSTFTLYLPQVFSSARLTPTESLTDVTTIHDEPSGDTVVPGTNRLRQLLDMAEDDRALIQPGDPVVLIVEDDRDFAHVLLHTVRERGFKGL